MTGAFSGFFGIGGGFLIVPGLIFAAGLPIINAVGSSLLVVTASGATAALNYAASGFMIGVWPPCSLPEVSWADWLVDALRGHSAECAVFLT